MQQLSKRQRLNILEGQMRLERESFKSLWRDQSDFILPRRSRFFLTDVNKGDRRNRNIIDSTASLAARTLASGMMTGVTSPARAWFKLNTSNPTLNESAAVKGYLKTVEDKMRAAFLKSNLYNQLPTLYGDLGTFLTAALYMEEDMEDVANFTALLIGSYCIANDKKGRVRTFFREFQMSVRQLVDKWGRTNPDDPSFVDWTKFSPAVRSMAEANNWESMVNVIHFVCPNPEYNPKKLESKYKKFASYYYEQSETDKFLSEKGYDYFPVMVVRWEVAGEDTYGTNGPGMTCLGDIRQLQLGERRIMEAIDQKVKPSMVGPTALRNANASIIPGDITYIDEREGSKGIRKLFEVDFDIRELEGKQAQLRERISKAFYEDLFLMLASSDRRQITAREIEERHEEKLLALGPVLERINQDLLDPLIENMFHIMEAQGLLPELPEELAGQDYTIEYISVMAQAQKLAGIGNIERFTGFVGQLASFDPTILQKVNLEAVVEEYADKAGVNPSLLKSKEEMEAIREEQAAQQAQMQEAAVASEMVNAGKTLSETKMDENSALTELIGT